MSKPEVENVASNIIEVYKERRRLEQSGVWCKLPAGRIKVKSAIRNPEFARKVKPFAENLGELQEDDAAFKEVIAILAETIVLDWDGFGEDYTSERFIEICEELKDCGFAEDVLQFILDKDLFNQIAVAKAGKN